MRPHQRQEAILNLVASRGRVMVDDLATRFGASRETIRRDLGALAGLGRLRKFHGGAERNTARHNGSDRSAEGPAEEGPFAWRMQRNRAAKQAIARAAAALFHPGDSLFIDTGTTTVYFAEELARRGGMSVVTNSATIAGIVAGTPGNAAYLLGGAVRADAAETVGPLTVEQVGNFRADHVVLTVGALNAEAGAMDYLIEEAEVARAMVARGGQLTVLADSSKLGRSALFEICPLGQIHSLVVERPVTGSLAGMLAAAGVRVVIADA